MKNGQTTNKVEYNFPQPKQKLSWTKIIYNSDDGTYFGRTLGSWAKITLFYIIFYIVLAGLVTICIRGLLGSLSRDEPKWKLHESLIGTNPGLGFRPLPEETERGSVIQFDTKKSEEGRYWKELLDKFLKDYSGTGKNRKFCSYNRTRNPEQVCAVDMDTFGPCSPNNNYGYLNGSPCVFLKLNRIYNWVPEYYDNVNQLPDDMPADLKEHINKTKESERQQIWISCNGQHSLDKENMGEIAFYPSRGFDAFYYPYMKQPGYLSPLIAVQFKGLKVHQMVNIECRAWSKNIIYSGSIRDRQGSVTFQIFMD